ncbi:MAG: hypothetical protein FWG78_02505 [Coriobacteriia bacterium]|nr:hypothetical protein [Coriobacteriia bacterium]
MRRFVTPLIIILLVFLTAPQLAGATLRNEDIVHLHIIAIRDEAGERIVYRFHAHPDVELPQQIDVALHTGARVADVYESDGNEWWPMGYAHRGTTLTLSFIKGRIAEAHIREANLFQTQNNGALHVTIPLEAVVGIQSVLVGATLPTGYRCIEPEGYTVERDEATSAEVVTLPVSVTGDRAADSITFVFQNENLPIRSAEVESGETEATPSEPGQYVWWPLVLLCVAFAIVGAAYAWLWYREQKDAEEELGDEDDELDEDEPLANA